MALCFIFIVLAQLMTLESHGVTGKIIMNTCIVGPISKHCCALSNEILMNNRKQFLFAIIMNVIKLSTQLLLQCVQVQIVLDSLVTLIIVCACIKYRWSRISHT